MVETILGSPGDPSTEARIEAPSAEDREVVPQLWAGLEKLTHEQRLAVVEELEEYQSWALCERVAAASIEEAASQPPKALKLAFLAQRIAELVSGPAPWCLRLQGYAGVHVSNARRVNNDVPAAEADFSLARKLWEAGAPGDPGLLNEAIVLGIEATLRDAQRRFPEALRRIDEALVADSGYLQGRLLLAKAQFLEALGDLEASTAVLSEAAPRIDREREPRTAFGLELQLHVNLCLQGRAAEAEPGLPRVRVLGERLGQELDLLKVTWLEGKVAAGMGRTAEAEEAFIRVRQEVTARGLAYDAALVSLDLALLYLEQGRMAEVRTLAESMAWIFAAQGVEREAVAALRLFSDAARKEAASVELAKRMVRYLHRAQHDPGLKFEGSRGAESS
jgi:tetratricopeptide (TPR) repeat protein